VHGYPGGHDVGMLATGVRFSACRVGAGAVVRLENAGAGHNVPTGDVHRHLVARAWRSSAPERLHEIFVGRRAPLGDLPACAEEGP